MSIIASVDYFRKKRLQEEYLGFKKDEV